MHRRDLRAVRQHEAPHQAQPGRRPARPAPLKGERTVSYPITLAGARERPPTITRSLCFSGLPCRGPFRAAPALLVAAAALAAARPADAGPCNLLPKPVYVTGSGKVT